jgi:phage terminase small subunit
LEGLSEKQQAFVREYLIDFNGAQAAIRAGYAENSARVTASRLLADVNVSRALREAIDARAQRVQVDADYVLSKLTKTLERCQGGKVVYEYDPSEKAMVPKTDDEGNVVWEFDSAGSNRAAELIGKHLGLFNDKTEHTGTINVVFGDDPTA